MLPVRALLADQPAGTTPATSNVDGAHLADTLRALGYNVKINDPYKGVELVRAFSDPDGNRHSLQVEVNRKLYMDEKTRAKNDGFGELQSNLAKLLERVAAYAAERGSHLCGAHDHGHHHHHGHDHGHGHHGDRGHRHHGHSHPDHPAHDHGHSHDHDHDH